MGPKVVKKDFFSKLFQAHLGCSKHMDKGYFEPQLPHIRPCKFPKTFEMGTFRTDDVYGGSGANVLCLNALDCGDHQ